MYTEKVYGRVPKSAGAAQNLAVAAVHSYLELVLSQFLVKRIAAIITTSVVSTGAVVVKFYDRPTPGSAAAQVTIGTLNIPAGTLVGSVVYKDVTAYSMHPGHELAMEVTTASAGGGAAGGAVYAVEGEDDPESVLDQPTMIASA